MDAPNKNTMAMRKWRAANPKVYTEEDRERDRVYRKRIRLKLKKSVFDQLGGECQCCGEEELMFLCLDHKKGGGSKHRKEQGSSYRLLYWLQRQINELGVEVVKEDYRILCWNCNSALGLFGYCPHQEVKHG